MAQLRRFAAEVTRVALEVGTEGQLGGTANVEGVQGEWKTLTDNVNLMAMNLTQQVRPFASHLSCELAEAAFFRAGALDRRCHEGCRRGRPFAQDHGRGQGRDA